MSSEKIRVEVISAGEWAKYGHIPALQTLGDFEIVAVSSRRMHTAAVAMYPLVVEAVTATSGAITLAIDTR